MEEQCGVCTMEGVRIPVAAGNSFRFTCRLRGGATVQEQFDALFGNGYSYFMGHDDVTGDVRTVTCELDMQEICNYLDIIDHGSGRLNISPELFAYIVQQINTACLLHEGQRYNKLTHGVSKQDFRRNWVGYFASLRKQANRLVYGKEGTPRHREQEHTVRAMWIYVMTMKTITYETPSSRTHGATLVVRRTALTADPFE